jgi:hypothetical protein
MNANTMMAAALKMNARMLAYAYEMTPEENRSWEPDAGKGHKGRSAKEQMDECVKTTNMIADMLDGKKPDFETPLPDTPLEEQLMQAADKAGEKLAAAPPEKMDEKVTASWGEVPLKQVCAFMVENLMYHCGQVSYIQTLYGDEKFHVPPEMSSAG